MFRGGAPRVPILNILGKWQEMLFPCALATGLLYKQIPCYSASGWRASSLTIGFGWYIKINYVLKRSCNMHVFSQAIFKPPKMLLFEECGSSLHNNSKQGDKS